MTSPILKIANLNKSFGGVVATENVSLEIHAGEVHALIGPNGAGKTTLVSQISGILSSDSGEIEFDHQNITCLSAPKRSLKGLARSFQITSILKDFTCQENVVLAIQAHSGHSFHIWRQLKKEKKLQDRALEVLETIGLGMHCNTIAGELAYGEQRQLEIAVALAMAPKLLVLDEPLAGMGRTDSAEMIRFLKTLKGKYSILLIEHDMDAVFELADTISVMVYGRLIASGSPKTVRSEPIVREAYLGRDD